MGIVGCGNIAGIYAENSRRLPEIDLVACADLDPAKAREFAARHGISAVTVDELLADPSVELIINLTTPLAHYAVARAALQNGKHVYNEKPLAGQVEEGRELLTLAAERGLRVGGAPDTFMGAGYQTAKNLIERGEIGRPLSAVAMMLCPGHEHWHPNPAFYYQPGAGPMFDMGPYYLTAMVHLFGRVRRVQSTATRAHDRRLISSQTRAGEFAEVEVDTHIQALLEFESGFVATLITSFDVQAHQLPHLQVFGSAGSLNCPDPNGFGGPLHLWTKDSPAWTEVALETPHHENWRGLGVADLIASIGENREPAASGELAQHVLEVMHLACTAQGV
ncbi:MAG: Gfo/Idh/MocA family oxidoreductase [Chthonomonas sp.]|nr:Gfo/Idh/MocA family oxidoreductase [Chthonomonas sp.]